MERTRVKIFYFCFLYLVGHFIEKNTKFRKNELRVRSHSNRPPKKGMQKKRCAHGANDSGRMRDLTKTIDTENELA